MKTIRLLLLVLLCAFAAQAQTTSISGTITAAGGQVYANGTYTFQLVGGNAPFYLGGVQMTLAQTTITGVLDSGGSFTGVAVGKTASIAPAGTSWLFTACPNASAPCWSQNIGIVSGTSSNISSTITPPAIKVSPTPNVLSLAYSDAEIQGPVTGTTYWNTVSLAVRVCTAASNGTCSNWQAGGSSNAPGTAGALPEAAIYTVYLNSGTVYARNNTTGAIDYSGTDAGPVINSILTNNSTTCGTVNFKNGDYQFNSMTLESTGGYTNFYYAVGIPAGVAGSYCQWRFVGESANMTGQGANALTTGAIFDVTAAARTSCGTGHECIAWWHRPDTTNHLGNDIVFQNITTRFPDNQRGNEAAYLMWEASTVDFYNVMATLNVAIGSGVLPTITPAVAGANHMIAFSSTMPSRNNWQEFKNTWAIGFDIGYDIESEHSILDAASAWANNYFGYYGRLTTFGSYTIAGLFHPSVWKKVTDQENINGLVLGSNIAQGSRLDILGYDIETASSGAFVRSTNFTETNAGYTSGIITYTVVSGGTGVISETPPDTLFGSGGANFQLFESTAAPNIAKAAISDTFTRPNSPSIASGQNLGPSWISNSSSQAANYCGITSNTAVTGGAAATGVCIQSYVGQPAQPDQFGKFTVSNASANGQTDVIVRASRTANTQTYYEYDCSTSGGQIAKRRIGKEVASSFTQLAITAANSGCANGDQMELWAIGTTIIGFYTPSGGSRVVDLIATDSAITSGQPGVFIFNNATAASPSITNFVAGNLLANGVGSSIYGQAQFAPTYNTITNCAGVGTAASPSVASCGSAAAGQFSCATNATGATCTVNTTAVTANSEIFVQDSDTTTTGTFLGVTCNTSTAIDPTSRLLASSVVGTSFTINLGTVTTNPACFSYHIVN